MLQKYAKFLCKMFIELYFALTQGLLNGLIPIPKSPNMRGTSFLEYIAGMPVYSYIKNNVSDIV